MSMVILVWCLFFQVVPVDLPQKELFWSYYEDDFMINIVKKELGRDYFAACVLALMKNEQGTRFGFKFPDNNCGGLHPWGKRFPWGWAKYYWVRLPDGYFFAREGRTGLRKPYFSFKEFSDFLLVTYKIVRIRGIINGRAYGRKWVGSGRSYPQFDYWAQQYYLKLLPRW